MPEKKYPKGHWMGVGIGFGMMFGVALFFIVDLLTGDFGDMFFLGPGAGVAIGVSIGAALEKKYEGRIRELTPQEKNRISHRGQALRKARAILREIGGVP